MLLTNSKSNNIRGGNRRLPPVAELAAHYGVARSTVISALRRIEADGLIEIIANWGTFRVLAYRPSGQVKHDGPYRIPYAYPLPFLPSACHRAP